VLSTNSCTGEARSTYGAQFPSCHTYDVIFERTRGPRVSWKARLIAYCNYDRGTMKKKFDYWTTIYVDRDEEFSDPIAALQRMLDNLWIDAQHRRSESRARALLLTGI
jgi:hypothetical protein